MRIVGYTVKQSKTKAWPYAAVVVTFEEEGFNWTGRDWSKGRPGSAEYEVFRGQHEISPKWSHRSGVGRVWWYPEQQGEVERVLGIGLTDWKLARGKFGLTKEGQTKALFTFYPKNQEHYRRAIPADQVKAWVDGQVPHLIPELAKDILKLDDAFLAWSEQQKNQRLRSELASTRGSAVKSGVGAAMRHVKQTPEDQALVAEIEELQQRLGQQRSAAVLAHVQQGLAATTDEQLGAVVQEYGWRRDGAEASTELHVAAVREALSELTVERVSEVLAASSFFVDN